MPEYNEKRDPMPCHVCGKLLYLVYTSWNVYHNEVESGWRRESHFGQPTACIRYLAEKLADLEKRVP